MTIVSSLKVCTGAILVASVALQTLHAMQLTVDADFPGGNVVVREIEGDLIHLEPDLRDTNGWWFYWCFRVRGAAGRNLTFQFHGNNPIGTRGPAISLDQGITWNWLNTGSVQEGSFRYEIPGDCDDARFCFTIPYRQVDLEQFLRKFDGNPYLQVDSLCTTRKGRSVERIRICSDQQQPEHCVLLTARHHACESIANFALEGLLETALSDSDDGRWLRSHVDLLAIPFVDKDGVEQGDQGKNRRPHDHNRDYAGQSVYASVAAIRTYVPHWAQGRLHVTLDLHCPWIRGPHNEVIYQVGASEAAIWEQQARFGTILERAQQGTLQYRQSDDLPFGTAWNTNANYGGLKSCSAWARELDSVRLASSIEIPYANLREQTMTADRARAFGRDLARALVSYFQQADAP